MNAIVIDLTDEEEAIDDADHMSTGVIDFADEQEAVVEEEDLHEEEVLDEVVFECGSDSSYEEEEDTSWLAAEVSTTPAIWRISGAPITTFSFLLIDCFAASSSSLLTTAPIARTCAVP